MPGTVLRIITRLNRGGPLRQLCALVPGLEAHGWHGPVIAGQVGREESDGSADLLATGADVRPLRSLQRGLDPSRDARATKRLLALLRSVRPDVVHTHMGKAGALGRVAARIAGVPCVHTVHGHHLDGGRLTSAAARWSERLLGTAAAAVIALSPRQARDLVEVHRVLRREQVHVIAPGMDLEGFRARAQVPGQGPAWDADEPHFLWTGRFVPVKDPLLLVDAVGRSTERYRLTLLGRGPLWEPVRAAIRTAGLEDRIECPGSVADVAPWVAAADAVVLSSRSEGMPLSIIEALALGTPVVVPTVGGLPDLVAHEQTGLWVPPGSAQALAAALDRLAADAALRRRLGRAGCAQADERFSAARLASETAALYEQVAGRG